MSVRAVRRTLSASVRKIARLSGPWSFRLRALSSSKPTSSTQCRQFSIRQCARTAAAKATGSSIRNSREMCPERATRPEVQESPRTMSHARARNRPSRRNSRRRKSRRSTRSSKHPKAYDAGRCRSEDREVRRDSTRSTTSGSSTKKRAKQESTQSSRVYPRKFLMRLACISVARS